MIDRYSINQGMYNAFDHRISVGNLEDVPLFYHEYYHHIQNISTILGAERLNLLVQFLAHTRNLTASHDRLYVPFNRWFDQGAREGSLDPGLRKRLENIVFHQDEWLYLDKIAYTARIFSENELSDETLALVDNPEKGAPEPYLLRRENGQFKGYPVGGFTVSESGAFALQLFHTPGASPDALPEVDFLNYQYLVVLEWVRRLIPDFRLACLATFLLCDLAMVVSTPAMGFYAVYQSARFFFNEKMDQEKLLTWYEHVCRSMEDEIKGSISLEMEIINDVRRAKNGLHPLIDRMFEWQLDLVERGLALRLDDQPAFIRRLLSGKQKDLDDLLKSFPLTLIETTDDGRFHYESEDDLNNYELLNASYNLFLGLCRNFNHIVKNEAIIHTRKRSENTFAFELVTDGGQSDAYGYIIHTLGLNDKELILLN